MPKRTVDKIEFYKIPLKIKSKRKVLYDFYYVFVNDRCREMSKYLSLPVDTQEDINDIIERLATFVKVKSDKVKYSLRGYSYGEIRPMPIVSFFFKNVEITIYFLGM